MEEVDLSQLAIDLNEFANNVVAPYMSDTSESKNISLATIAPKETRNQTKIYEFCTSYSSREAAEAVLTNEKIWAKRNEHKPRNLVDRSKKIFYRCKLAKSLTTCKQKPYRATQIQH